MRQTFLVLILGISVEWGAAQFLNNRPFPTYSLESMPDTGFTCRDKILGGYYADPETQCQMFHICVKVAGIGVQDFRFLCPNATAFDQDHQICAEWDDVDCDATTLYYSSDNFDLYRIGSGFESKAVKYGEEEETFALQRAETGDARLNREHQAQRVNQQKQYQTQFARNRPNSNNYNQDVEKDIFKGSSSSNFFNNRNNGKELDDDFGDGNANSNQNRDFVQKKKIIRKQQRRPQASTAATTAQQDEQTQRPNKPTGFINNFAGSSYQPTTQSPASVQPDVPRIRNSHRRGPQQMPSGPSAPAQTHGQQRPTTQYTVSTPAPFRQTQAHYAQPQQQKATSTENYPSNFPQQKIVKHATTTPAAQQINTRQQQTSTTLDNFNPSKIHYDVPKIKATKQADGFTQTVPKQPPTRSDNYPTTFAPKVKYDFTKQQSKFELNQPTTFAPRTNVAYTQQQSRPSVNQQSAPPQYNVAPQGQNRPLVNQQTGTQFNGNNQQQSRHLANQQPTQFANNQPQQPNNAQSRPSAGQQSPQVTQPQFNISPHSQPFAKQFSGPATEQAPPKQDLTTQRTTPFTQYTPTVPKVTSTTPVSRANRFDETQYDDGSYNSKYDNYDNGGSPDEFLKTAHSQNIASSRNEFIKNAQKPSSQTPASTTTKPFYNESPRPFSASSNTPKFTDYPKTAKTTQGSQVSQQSYQQTSQQPLQYNPQKGVTTPKQQQQQQQQIQKQQPQQVKQVKKDYDYAYYDSNADEYESLDTDVPKEFSKTK